MNEREIKRMTDEKRERGGASAQRDRDAFESCCPRQNVKERERRTEITGGGQEDTGAHVSDLNGSRQHGHNRGPAG